MPRNLASVSVVVLVIGLIVALGLATPGSAAVQAIVTIDPNTTYQTMTGWESTDYIGEPNDPSLPNYKDKMLDLAVNDIGINRIRLEVKSGSENPRDYYTEYRNGQIDYATWRCVRYSTTNDNADPASANTQGFHFSELDWKVENMVLPMKSRLEAKGEKLFVNLEYVAFTAQIRGTGCSSTLTYVHNNPAEYAEFILATTQHLKNKYGLTPDSWEIILEPDTVGEWSNGTVIANALKATAARLEAAGFAPRFVVPSAMSMATARSYFDQMIPVLGDAAIRKYVSEIAYHRYAGVNDVDLQAIASRAAQYGIGGSMLEWWDTGNGYATLHKDLTMGRNSAWQQEVLGGLFTLDTSNPSNPSVEIKPTVKLTRQYFKFVRAGAVRIGASTSNSSFDPVAFEGANGRDVVVVKAASAGTFAVQGLPTGTYGINYSTNTQYDVSLADVSVVSGQSLEATIPAAGVITVYGKEGTATSPTMPAPSSTPTRIPPTPVPPTATAPSAPTIVPVPPTQTAVPSITQVPPAPTSTAVPPTATRIPATSTTAPAPATATPVPPAATAVPSDIGSGPSTISVNQTQVNAGNSVTVKWGGLPTGSASYCIELYKLQSSGNWSYVNGFDFAANGKTSGSKSYRMPSEAGTYEFRLLDSKELRLATSGKVTVKNSRTR